jgi:hypothetical protein
MLTINEKARLEAAWTNADTCMCLDILKGVGIEPRCATCSIETWLLAEISELIENGELFN